MKVLLNKCFGGFEVSEEGYMLYAKKKGIKLYPYDRVGITRLKKAGTLTDSDHAIGFREFLTKDYGDEVNAGDVDWEHDCLYLREEHREDPILIKVVEELGSAASGRYGKLRVVEIPDALNYVIDDYDGIETLHEDVPTW